MKKFFNGIVTTMGRFLPIDPKAGVNASFMILVLFSIISGLVYTTLILVLAEVRTSAKFDIGAAVTAALAIKIILSTMGAIGFALLYPTTSTFKKWMAGIFGVVVVGWDGYGIKEVPWKIILPGTLLMIIVSLEFSLLVIAGDLEMAAMVLLAIIPFAAAIATAAYGFGYLLAKILKKDV